MNQYPVVFLLGPTACGKTASSILLAEQLNAEIVSVDSALVYRDMNIGTAKPDSKERAGIAHHLIDVCDPDEAYSVARFCDDALRIIDDIQRRNKLALLTGGTMLYFNALEKGIAPLPDANAELREVLSKEAETIGWPGMHKKLARIDPLAAERIHPNDPQRLQRALEVHQLTGQALSDLQKNTKPLLPVPPLKFALLPDSRAWLHERISRRFVQMLDNGFLDEVRDIQQKYAVKADMPSMRSVGYRQAWQHLAGEYDQHSMIDKAQAATRQLAKRQMTWIRSMDGLNALSCDKLEVAEQVETMVTICTQQLPKTDL